MPLRGGRCAEAAARLEPPPLQRWWGDWQAVFFDGDARAARRCVASGFGPGCADLPPATL